MGETTAIEWCHHTFNAWEGCARVSPGCENCYAEARDKRFTGGIRWGVKAERRIASEAYWRQPLKWNAEAQAAGERRRVFCASLADVFEDRPELAEPRARLWDLMLATPWLDWLLLTKRPENAERLARAATVRAFHDLGAPHHTSSFPPNAWLGVTAENQAYADKRIPIMLGIAGPAVYFVSYEPALGPVDFTRVGTDDGRPVSALARHPVVDPPAERGAPGVDWIIVGGESGTDARPFDLAWARNVIAQCKAAGVAAFCKQLGAVPVSTHDADLCGRVGDVVEVRFESPSLFHVALKSKKGGDMSEWPEDLRVREFPEVPR